MTTDDQDELYQLLDKYNQMIEPLESWQTADISKLIGLLDAELQRRYDETRHFTEALSQLEDFDEFDLN